MTYRKSGIFMVWKTNISIERGIKIHIFATQIDAQDIAVLVLPYPLSRGFDHKVIAATENIRNDDEQTKKFITVYPKSAAECREALVDLEARFTGSAFRSTGSSIQGDQAYGNSGRIFPRYGNFLRSDGSDDRGVVSSKVNDFLSGTDVFKLSAQAQRARQMRAAAPV